MRKVWGRKSSSNVQAVTWCLRVLGLDYERIDAGISYGVVNTEQYLAMNPNGTIPTLVENDSFVLWESSAIIRYLANQYAPESFWPADPVARSIVDQWAEWSKINIALGFTAPVFWKVVRTAPSRQEPDLITANLKVLNKYLGIADNQLEHNKYLAGDQLTVADIQFGHVLYRYYDIDINRADHPNVRRYYDMLAARDDYQRVVIVSYEELRVND